MHTTGQSSYSYFLLLAVPPTARFWLRFANLPFSLDCLDVYEKHFTVMNYDDDAELQQMFCHDFVKVCRTFFLLLLPPQLFEEQNPSQSWAKVQADIFSMLKAVFEGATALPPPCGIGACPQVCSLLLLLLLILLLLNYYYSQAGAMYATDLMLDWVEGEGGRRVQPKVHSTTYPLLPASISYSTSYSTYSISSSLPGARV